MKNNLVYPVSVIDVGSNSVRLLTQYETHKEKSVIITRLAEGFKNGYLLEQSMERTANAVKELVHKSVLNGSNSLFAFATAAVRNSVNGSDFVNLVKAKAGVEIKVVSGELEAELAGIGALRGESGLVVDIGGASTEIIIKDNGKTQYLVSYPVGAVNLREKGLNIGETLDYLSSLIKGVKIAVKGDSVAIGGTSLTLTAMSLGLTEYNRDKTHGTFLSKGTVYKLIEELNFLTPSQIIEKYPFAKGRENYILGGSAILYSVLNVFNLEGVYASENDNLEGYLKFLTYEK